MNSISRGVSGKKSRAGGSSLYMYSQTHHNLVNRKAAANKKGIRSYSNKRERVGYIAPRSNDKGTNIESIFTSKFSKNKVIDLSDSKSRKRLNN